MGFIFN